MTSLRIENICLQASLELNETVHAYRARIDVSREAQVAGGRMLHFRGTMCCLADSFRFDLLMECVEADVSGSLMSNFLMTMCCLADTVRFDLLMESLKADAVEV